MCKSNASEFRRISWLFEEFRFKRNFHDFSANFQVTYCFIPPELSNDNSRWTLTSHEILRESSLFSIVNREILDENSLWSLSALTRTKQNTATVRDLLLCKEMLRTSEITFIKSINYHIVLTCWLFDFQCILPAKNVRVSVQTCCFNHVSTPDSKTWIERHFVRVTSSCNKSWHFPLGFQSPCEWVWRALFAAITTPCRPLSRSLASEHLSGNHTKILQLCVNSNWAPP